MLFMKKNTIRTDFFGEITQGGCVKVSPIMDCDSATFVPAEWKSDLNVYLTLKPPKKFSIFPHSMYFFNTT